VEGESTVIESRAVEIHAHVPKIGKSAGHWLLEGLFIVISVLLGFGVAQYRESRADRELAARAAGGIPSPLGGRTVQSAAKR
jgi:Zn-dependent protease with chaperone function